MYIVLFRFLELARYLAIVLAFFSMPILAGNNETPIAVQDSELYLVIIGERDINIMLTRVKQLISLGADVNYTNVTKEGMESSVLAKSVDRQEYSLVKLLLDEGANPNPLHRQGCTPIGSAISRANQEIIRLLISHKADLSKPSCYREDRTSRSALSVLLLSGTVTDETRLYALGYYSEAGNRWGSKELRSMIRKEKYKVAKRMIELVPSSLDELARKKILSANSNDIRSLKKLF